MKSHRLILSALLASILFFVNAAAIASDWPRWLGPNGDNIAPETAFEADLSKWKVAWTTNVGLGYSSVAVVGDRAYTMGHDGKGKETVYCLNAVTGGEPIWKYSYDCPLLPLLHTGGPNATTTIVGNKVISLSKDGQVFCFSADKGDVLWKANLGQTFGTKLPKWGYASSAVIDGNQVLFCSAKVGAFDIETGKSLWVSKTEYLPAGYATSPVFEYDGKKFVAALDGKGLSVLSAKDGEEVARYAVKANYDMNATTPMVLAGGKRIMVAANTGTDMVNFDGKTLTQAWTTKELMSAMNNSVVQDGAIYGCNGFQGKDTNSLKCLSEADGKELWSQPGIGYATIIAVGKTLLLLTEKGELITVKADQAKYSEISRKQVLEKTCWTNPTFAGGRIYARNDQGKLVVLGQ